MSGKSDEVITTRSPHLPGEASNAVAVADGVVVWGAGGPLHPHPTRFGDVDLPPAAATVKSTLMIVIGIGEVPVRTEKPRPRGG